MGLKPLPSNCRHRNIEGTRVRFYFSCRSALALRASCSKPGLKPWVFSDLQTLEGACFDRPCLCCGSTHLGQASWCVFFPGKEAPAAIPASQGSSRQAETQPGGQAQSCYSSADNRHHQQSVTQGSVSKGWYPLHCHFPPAATSPCPGCITPAEVGTVQHRLHPGLGQSKPVRNLAPAPFSRILAGSSLLEKAIFPQASSHTSPELRGCTGRQVSHLSPALVPSPTEPSRGPQVSATPWAQAAQPGHQRPWHCAS